jgi:hypothetical protein
VSIRYRCHFGAVMRTFVLRFEFLGAAASTARPDATAQKPGSAEIKVARSSGSPEPFSARGEDNKIASASEVAAGSVLTRSCDVPLGTLTNAWTGVRPCSRKRRSPSSSARRKYAWRAGRRIGDEGQAQDFRASCGKVDDPDARGGHERRSDEAVLSPARHRKPAAKSREGWRRLSNYLPDRGTVREASNEPVAVDAHGVAGRTVELVLGVRAGAARMDERSPLRREARELLPYRRLVGQATRGELDRQACRVGRR